MCPPVDPIPGIDSKVESLGCYSGLYTSDDVRVFYPDDPGQIHTIFARARQKRLRVTFRAGGHSFDSQSLGDQIVVSMSRLNRIEPLPGELRVRVEPGATWGAILARLQPLGLVPAVTVTTAHATAGGTLSGDCLSRFSPAYGKEGTWIEHFRLITPQGRILDCRPARKDSPPSGWNDEERAFAGVVSGLGYLGAVVSITYRVLRVAEPGETFGVQTIVRKYDTCRDLAEDLIPETRRTFEEDSDPQDRDKFDAIYSALVPRGKREPSALYFTSAFVPAPKFKRMKLHRPEMLARLLVEWGMRVRLLRRLIWWWAWRFEYKDRESYIDHLDGFTFFVDGNARAKRLWPFGTLKTVQQTFVVPSDPENGWRESGHRLTEWLEHTQAYFAANELEPTLHDILWLPTDLPFLMSATADMAGFAVSYAFETSDEDEIRQVKKAFSELSDDLWKDYGGRVYLVKNVSAKKSTLAEMYGQNARDFFELKRDLDPTGILRNEFLERTFGDYL